MAKVCDLCGKKIGFGAGSVNYKDGVLCYPCHNGVTAITKWSEYTASTKTVAEAKYVLEDFSNLKDTYANFQATEVINSKIKFNDNERKLAILAGSGKAMPYIIDYSEIIDCEIMEESEGQKGMAGATTAGLLLGGPLVGAVVAGARHSQNKKRAATVNAVAVKITTTGDNEYDVYIMTEPARREDHAYVKAISDADKTCDKIRAILSGAINAPANETANSNSAQSIADNADALIKLKQLVDMGIISQEEFDQKKKELLGL